MSTQEFRKVHLQNLDYKPSTTQQIDMKSLWCPDESRKVITYLQSCTPHHQQHFDNGFFSAFLYAYNQHGDVKITPDDVWLTIMLYFSKYVDENAEELRHAFVDHEGKKELVVDSEVQFDQISNFEEEFFIPMMKEIKVNTTQGVTQKFQCDFSTTQFVQRVVSTAVIMSTYKKYYNYTFLTRCGIQNIHFGGSLEDWEKIVLKTKNLAEYDINGVLKRYVKNVTEILAKFIETYEGKVDLQFWNRIIHQYQSNMSSGRTGPYITGWLIKLFGYEEVTKDVSLPEIDVPITVRSGQMSKVVKMKGGFKAVQQDGQIFRPHLSLVIFEELNSDKNQEGEKKIVEMGQNLLENEVIQIEELPIIEEHVESQGRLGKDEKNAPSNEKCKLI